MTVFFSKGRPRVAVTTSICENHIMNKSKEHIERVWDGLRNLCREAGDIGDFDDFGDLGKRPCQFNYESIPEMLQKVGPDSEKASKAWADGVAATHEGRHPIELKSDPLGHVLEELSFLAGRRLKLDRTRAEAFAGWLTETITDWYLDRGHGRLIDELERVALDTLEHSTGAVIRAYQRLDFFDKFPSVITAAVQYLLSDRT